MGGFEFFGPAAGETAKKKKKKTRQKKESRPGGTKSFTIAAPPGPGDRPQGGGKKLLARSPAQKKTKKQLFGPGTEKKAGGGVWASTLNIFSGEKKSTGTQRRQGAARQLFAPAMERKKGGKEKSERFVGGPKGETGGGGAEKKPFSFFYGCFPGGGAKNFQGSGIFAGPTPQNNAMRKKKIFFFLSTPRGPRAWGDTICRGETLDGTHSWVPARASTPPPQTLGGGRAPPPIPGTKTAKETRERSTGHFSGNLFFFFFGIGGPKNPPLRRHRSKNFFLCRQKGPGRLPPRFKGGRGKRGPFRALAPKMGRKGGGKQMFFCTSRKNTKKKQKPHF